MSRTHTKKNNNVLQSLFSLLLKWASSSILGNQWLRWPEPIYMRVGYVFDLRFSERKIQPISMSFGILNKE